MAYFQAQTIKIKVAIMAGSTTSTGLGAADWAGMGLQVGGAILADKSAKEQAEEEERLRMATEMQRIRERQQDRMDMLRTNEERMALDRRGMNQRGLETVIGLSQNSAQNARRKSFRAALAPRGY